mgnify:CR=1 FL=1
MRLVDFCIVDSAGATYFVTANGNCIQGDYVVFWFREHEETFAFYKPISVVIELDSRL